jgi:hypothetical protein
MYAASPAFSKSNVYAIGSIYYAKVIAEAGTWQKLVGSGVKELD